MKKYVLLTLCFLLNTFCSTQQTQDVIYYNGYILTMNDDQGTVEALATSKGKIVALGTMEEVMAYKNESTKMVDLQNKALLPGFIDPHGHTFGVGMQSVAANLYPEPDGKIKNINDILVTLKEYYDANPPLYKELKWVVGFGYDNSNLEEKRHPTKSDLDKVFPDIPVYIVHQSGHIGVANSKALEMLDITSATTNPEGGVIQRVGDTMEPNGVLEETAHLDVFYEVGQFSPLFAANMFLSGVDTMMSNGYTTAQEGRAAGAQMIIMNALAWFKKLPIDIIAYADLEKGHKWFKKISNEYFNRFRVGGVKLTIDGSPQGKTAWRDEAYVVPPHGHSHDYKGYPAINEEVALDAIIDSFANDRQINVHANGEAAINLFLEGVEKAREQYPDKKDTRPVLIHGQFMRKSHVEKVKELDIFPSVFPLHTYYWGDWHREQTIGEPGVYHISPTKWLEDCDIPFTTHHDAPIVTPNSMMVLWGAVNRLSRTDKIIGEDQRISTISVLKSITKWASYQIFEENTKGTLEVGKLADLVILSENPLSVPPLMLTNIKVEETIKEGRVVYQRK